MAGRGSAAGGRAADGRGRARGALGWSSRAALPATTERRSRGDLRAADGALVFHARPPRRRGPGRDGRRPLLHGVVGGISPKRSTVLRRRARCASTGCTARTSAPFPAAAAPSRAPLPREVDHDRHPVPHRLRVDDAVEPGSPRRRADISRAEVLSATGTSRTAAFLKAGEKAAVIIAAAGLSPRFRGSRRRSCRCPDRRALVAGSSRASTRCCRSSAAKGCRGHHGLGSRGAERCCSGADAPVGRP